MTCVSGPSVTPFTGVDPVNMIEYISSLSKATSSSSIVMKKDRGIVFPTVKVTEVLTVTPDRETPNDGKDSEKIIIKAYAAHYELKIYH